MKNSITQFALVVIAFIGLTLLMSYTRPAAEEVKEYTVVFTPGKYEALIPAVNAKLAEGWRLQGGVAVYGGGHYQAMVK